MLVKKTKKQKSKSKLQERLRNAPPLNFIWLSAAFFMHQWTNRWIPWPVPQQQDSKPPTEVSVVEVVDICRPSRKMSDNPSLNGTLTGCSPSFYCFGKLEIDIFDESNHLASWWFPTHLKNICQIGLSPQVAGRNKTCLKPPPSWATLGKIHLMLGESSYEKPTWRFFWFAPIYKPQIYSRFTKQAGFGGI